TLDGGNRNLTDFLTDHGVVVALVCAAAGVLYGAIVTNRLLALPGGHARILGLSGAVQEGAKAYLNRQYMIIGVVAIVLAIVLVVLQGVSTGIGFVIGGVLSGAAGYIGMNVSVRSNSRVAEAGPGGGSPPAGRPFQGGA